MAEAQSPGVVEVARLAGLRQGHRQMKPADRQCGRGPDVGFEARCEVREWVLRRKTSVVNGIKLCRRRNFSAGAQDGVKEIEHLCAVDGVVPGNKNEHIAGSNDFFLIAAVALFSEAASA